MAHTIHIPMSSTTTGQAKSVHSKTSSQNLLYKQVPSLPPDASDPEANRFQEHGIFAGLLVITSISSVLLASSLQTWVLPINIQAFVNNNRATTSILVQIGSSLFGFLQVTPICALINRATRLILSKRKTSLDQLRFWALLCARGLGWHLSWKRLVVLWIFLFLTLNPSAIWAGAITPVDVETFQAGSGIIPSYEDMSLLHEYPSEYILREYLYLCFYCLKRKQYLTWGM